MTKILMVLLLTLLLVGCGAGNQLASHTGEVVDLIEEEQGNRIFVEGPGGLEDTIAFLIGPDLNDGINIGDNITVYYDSDALREESLPPNQSGVEKIEVNSN
ncbi:hypothetical protein BTS2_1839 [Bacillus sp. TS-2]|nr:hypothetical protein BTS2_1839 [Bacillus sp. TS-2]